MKIKVKEVAFSQYTVSSHFSDKRSLEELEESLLNGTVRLEDIPQIRVVKHRGRWYALDNRRLRVFKNAFIEEIDVIVEKISEPSIRREFFNKFNNKDPAQGGTINHQFSLSTKDQFESGIYAFTKQVLGWTVDSLEFPSIRAKWYSPLRDSYIEPESDSDDDNDYYADDFDQYHQYCNVMKALIFEELRAQLQSAIKANPQPLKLFLNKTPKFSKNAQNPCSFDFRVERIPQNIQLKPGSIFLLTDEKEIKSKKTVHSNDNNDSNNDSDESGELELDKFQVLALLGYKGDRDKTLLSSLPMKAVIDEETRQENFWPYILEKDDVFYGRVLAPITTFSRMFDACYKEPLRYHPLRENLLAARVTTYSASDNSDSSEDATLPTVTTTLNEVQLNAVNQFLKIKKGIQLIQGPPGTGKTTTIIGLLEILLHQNERALVCAPSNKAVQVLVERMQRQPIARPIILIGVEDKLPADDEDMRSIFIDTWQAEMVKKFEAVESEIFKIARSYQKWSAEVINRQCNSVVRVFQKHVDFGKFYGVLAKNQDPLQDIDVSICATGKSAHKNVLLKLHKILQAIQAVRDDIHTRNPDALKSTLLQNTNIVFCTLSVSGRAFLRDSLKSFNTLIVDEAAQCVEAETLIPFLHRIRKCLLIGDVNQLPATVHSSLAKEKNFERSLMSRMQIDNNQPASMLTIQYRMHPDIRSWPSRAFYQNKLTDGDNIRSRLGLNWRDANELPPLAFVNVVAAELQNGTSYVNHLEAQRVTMIMRYLKQVAALNLAKQVGIITFYSAQENRIKQELGKYRLPISTVQTVDSFQGDERDIIVISCVRSNKSAGIGFLKDFRRLNVAITRAKHHLILFGNYKTLTHHDSHVKALLSDLQKRDLVVQENTFMKRYSVSKREVSNNSNNRNNNNKNNNNNDNRAQKKALAVCRFFKPGKPNSCKKGESCNFAHVKNSETKKMSGKYRNV